MARIVEVILGDLCRGRGTEEDICRTVQQLWTKDGRLIAEFDSGPEFSQANPRSFVNGEVIRSL